MMNEAKRVNYSCPLKYLRVREHNASKLRWTPSTAYTSFLSSRLDVAHNLYRRDLFAHFGCVNAIEFSQEGCLLISGGDDRRVLLWNLEATMSGRCKPTPMKEEHSSNIFCLGFDSFNSKIFSAGNDEQVIVHDVKTGETVNVFMHEEAIYGVSVNPYVDSVFASAGEDGQVLIFDIRAPPSADPLLLARSYDAFYAVQFHPAEPTFLVTANSKEGVALWDVRKPRIPFVKYGENRCLESSMGARFNSSGSQIIALRRRMHPVLFNTHSASPVCEFDADHYYNSCTMKSCCFAGVRDEFVLSGSDDFSLYMWRIPDPHSQVNFVSEAHLILRGHRSIVNQVRFNSHNFTIASSGVEKIIKLWSAVPVPGSHGSLVDEKSDWSMTRRVYTHEDYIGLILDSGQTVSHDYSHGSTDEDPKMMAFFDSLVQREVEGWTTNTDLSDDDLDATSLPTQSSSSLPTSQSEDTDSDSAWASSRQNASPLRRRRLPTVQSFRDEMDEESPQGRPKPGQGSKWILRLIAKKRAQLEAAKKNRRSAIKKQKVKDRKFIRCLANNRQYLYRPVNNRSTSTVRHPIDRAPPPDLVVRRHVMAPYIIMPLGTLGESDDDDDDDSEEEGETNNVRNRADLSTSTSSFPTSRAVPSDPVSAEVSHTSAELRRVSYEARVWSSDSSSVSESEDASTHNTPVVTRNRALETGINPSGDSGAASSKGATSFKENRKAATSRRRKNAAGCSRSNVGGDRRSPIPSTPTVFPDVSNGVNRRAGAVPISEVTVNEEGILLFDPEGSPVPSPSLPSHHFLERVAGKSSEVLSSYQCRSKEELCNVSDSNRSSNCSSASGFSSNLSLSKRNSSSSIRRLGDACSSTAASTSAGRRLPRAPQHSEHVASEGCKKRTSNRHSGVRQELEGVPSTSSHPYTPPERKVETVSPSSDRGGNNSGVSDGGSADTPDSGICMGGRCEKGADESSSESDHRKDDPRLPSFKRRKIPEFRLKSYRQRRGEE